ncbi:MAG TPA: FecR domain-containing protein [Oxalicibacterium sp.]|uniref:FecR family protein n=1 Tax=Oxalicibacterium sp. TaxID=2766525 RepID=UPI002D03F761|nr:FecR domain-containing protein [Oxalicibacterium sp.]HWU99196.1 FecR domain-containing protein [Oxalicibacterium sp.]
MRKIFTGVLLSVVVSSSAFAEPESPDTNVRITKEGVWYSVSRDETLSTISLKFTGEISHWRAIGKTNSIENDRTIPIGKKIWIPARLLTPVSTFAKIRSFFGRVAIRSSDGTNIEPKIGAQLKEGDTLTTPADSFVSLVLDDGTQFTLPPDSSLNLRLLRKTQYIQSPRTELYLQKGRVESQVTPFTKPDSRFEVLSPLAVSGVRGTNFRVNYDDKRVFNEVIEGKVSVQPDAAKRKSAGQLVAAGYGTVVENGQARKPVPLLAAPVLADGYQNQERLPIHFSLAQPQAAAFRVRISTDLAGENNIAEAVAAANDGKAMPKVGDLEDGDYFVHYNAVDANGLSGIRNTLRFRVAARPFPPFLQAPGARYQGTGTDQLIPVIMQWSQVDGISRYRLQIAGDPAFGSPLVDQAIDTAGQDQGRHVAQLKAGTYYWRVASIVSTNGTSRQGPFGDAKKVDVIKSQSAPAVTLGEKDIHFTWSGSEGQHFTFQAADTSSFDKPFVSIETAQPEVAIPRPDAGIYYARVRSIDADGFVGSFSPAQKFVVPIYWQTGYGVPLRSQDQPLGTGF